MDSWIHGRGCGPPSYYEQTHQNAAVAAALAVKQHYTNNTHPHALQSQYSTPPNYTNNGYNYYYQHPPPSSQPADFSMQQSFWNYNQPPPPITAAVHQYHQRNAATFNINLSAPQNRHQGVNHIHSKNNSSGADRTKVRKEERKQVKKPSNQVRETTADDCKRALALEHEIFEKQRSTKSLVLHFPDPELSPEIICSYSKEIETVHFQKSVAPRFCFVQLKQGANVQNVIETISQIPFGNGYISAKLRTSAVPAFLSLVPEDINPNTLFVGNLPAAIAPSRVKEYFQTCTRLELGPINHTKKARHATVRFKSIEDAMTAFKHAVNYNIDGRFLTVHFWRRKKNNSAATNLPEDAYNTASTPIDAQDVQVDTKVNVFEEAQKLQAEMAAQPKSPVANGTSGIRQRRSSLQILLEDLEKTKQAANTNGNTSSNDVHIKQESDASEDEQDGENLLGSLNQKDVTVKSEDEVSDNTPIAAETLVETDYEDSIHEDHDYDEQFAVKKKRSEDLETENSTITNEHSTFVRNLYSQVRRAKENENSNTRSDDEMDDIFALMHSDSEDETF